jgi:G3E family GTPase
MKTEIINCECMNHSLHVKVDKDYNCVNLGLWLYGFNDGKLSWKNRFKILFDGYTDSDLIVLNKEELHKFITVLQEAHDQLEDLTPREKMIRQFENASGMKIDRSDLK